MSIADQLQDVLDDVQSRWTPASDLEVWSTPEYWIGINDVDLSGKVKGDCEDHVAMCRFMLRKLGIKSRIVYCIVPNVPGWGGHAVLEVDGYILDNLHGHVMERDLLNYKWVSISGYEPGDAWHEITN